MTLELFSRTLQGNTLVNPYEIDIFVLFHVMKFCMFIHFVPFDKWKK